MMPFGMRFTDQTEESLASEIATQSIDPGAGPRMVVTANLNHIVDLRRDNRFRSAYFNAWKITADGTPVYLYARLRGAGLTGRLTGSGLFAKLMPLLEPEEHRCFFVAPNPDAAQGCVAPLLARGF